MSHSLSRFDTEAVAQSCSNLSKTKIKQFINRDNTSASAAFLLWTEDTLTVLGLDSEQLNFLMGEIKDKLDGFIVDLCKAIEEKADKLPVATLAIADRRYLTISGASKLLDLQECAWVTEVKTAFLEIIQYNLTTLFMRRYLVLKHKD